MVITRPPRGPKIEIRMSPETTCPPASARLHGCLGHQALGEEVAPEDQGKDAGDLDRGERDLRSPSPAHAPQIDRGEEGDGADSEELRRASAEESPQELPKHDGDRGDGAGSAHPALNPSFHEAPSGTEPLANDVVTRARSRQERDELSPRQGAAGDDEAPRRPDEV